jgi:hypothetical protein
MTAWWIHRTNGWFMSWADSSMAGDLSTQNTAEVKTYELLIFGIFPVNIFRLQLTSHKERDDCRLISAPRIPLEQG